MTLSLVGRCGRTGMLGVGICSSSPAVAARCAHVRAGVGAATTQNVTDPRLGPALLDELGRGASAAAAIGTVVTVEPELAYRQLTALGARGRGAAYTGVHGLGEHGHRAGADCAAAGNLLADEAVLDALVEGFGRDPGAHLGERLMTALEAAVEAGAEAGQVHAAGLLVADAVPWPVVDLRVDWHDEPVAALRSLWELYAPQVEDYVTRALHPDRAPAYGVPGNER